MLRSLILPLPPFSFLALFFLTFLMAPAGLRGPCRPLAAVLLWVLAATALGADADADWRRRAQAPGVVLAAGFDDIREWARYSWEQERCNPAYQKRVDGRLAGCRNNAWDPLTRASGKGSVRFDVLPGTADGGGGSMAIPFGDYARDQFGAGSEFWISWRQRMDARYLQGYRARNGGLTYFKQVILAQGDPPAGRGRESLRANACSEGELVVVSSSPGAGPPFPVSYIECRRYQAFQERLKRGSYSSQGKGGTAITRQNMRTDPHGGYTCISHPPGLDQSGCFIYRPDQWITYMIHLHLGPEGRERSSVSGREQPGYVDSTYELLAAYPGEDFQLLHRQTGVVIPKGQYYLGGDPLQKSSYKPGWGPGNGHPEARYGRLFLLSYMTGKDPAEDAPPASTWYDEVIVSRCPIAAPGFPNPTDCRP